MKADKRYETAPGLRTALEERLKRVSRDEAVDLQRLRRQVAFDRFLSRLFFFSNTDWILKGGYAMELRFRTARSTKDLDFTVRTAPAGVGDTTLTYLQNVGRIDNGDHFSFRVSEATMDLDGAPSGGARYPVEALMAGRTFVKFHLDVGLGDVVVDPLEAIRARDWLGFANIAPPVVTMIQREQQFSEKIHAYTLPRSTPNSRVRDLVDLTLLVRSGTLNLNHTVFALRRTFDCRNTHPLPEVLNEPPESWDAPFSAMAGECSLKITAADAFMELGVYFESLIRNT
ncbi:MAG: nucleotidyl transferase AbiEii/AbiGii toxin family protein [Acidobacteriota bacterium]|nr:nucleotidyl transferase AbiEii/AbiGii toxin family protein [Acidobacteriota bacterium]